MQTYDKKDQWATHAVSTYSWHIDGEHQGVRSWDDKLYQHKPRYSAPYRQSTLPAASLTGQVATPSWFSLKQCVVSKQSPNSTAAPFEPATELKSSNAGIGQVPCESLPSVGSAGHAEGTCKRCAFFPKGRCLNGASCDHCHFHHPKLPKRGGHQRRREQLRTCGRSLHQDERLEESWADVYKDEAISETGSDAGLVFTIEQEDLDFCGRSATSSFGSDCQRSKIAESTPVSSPEVVAMKELNAAHISDLDVLTENVTKDYLGKQPRDELAEADTVTDKTDTATLSALGSDDEAAVSSSSDTSQVGDFESQQILGDSNTQGVKADSGQSEEVDCVHGQVDVCKQNCEHKSTLKSESKRKSGLSQLQISETSWVAQQRLHRQAHGNVATAAQVAPAEVAGKARSLLNKLTEERFESLCSQVIALPLSTPEHLTALVTEVFNKATTEQHFLSLYTDLCLRIDTHLTSNIDSEFSVGGKCFRRALVTECQASFERNLQQPMQLSCSDILDEDEKYEQLVKFKTRCLGNVRFIGKLFVQKLLAAKILLPVICDMVDAGTDVAMESLIVLLQEIAPHFEKKPLYAAPLKETFAKLQSKSQDESLPLRVRCKICDLLEERARGWVARQSQVLNR